MSEGRVALVTGAAGGIGEATAAALARGGYRVMLTDADADGLRAAAGRIRESASIAGDLSDMDFIASLVALTVERFGRVDALVNNAAWRERLSMDAVSVESWDRTLRVCVTAPAFLARDAAAAMRATGGGAIVNVSSVMAHRATGSPAGYVAAKGAIEAITRDLAVLYAPWRVRVLGVAPGAIDTALSADGEASLRRRSESMIPLARWGTPDEVASVIAWAVSDAASYVTGTTLVVDGGLLAQLYPREERS